MSINENPQNLRVKLFMNGSRATVQEQVNTWLASPPEDVGEVVSTDLACRGSAFCILVTYRIKTPT